MRLERERESELEDISRVHVDLKGIGLFVFFGRLDQVEDCMPVAWERRSGRC